MIRTEKDRIKKKAEIFLTGKNLKIDENRG
jgi:hypothetical protein